MRRRTRRLVVVAVTAAGLALAGCGSQPTAGEAASAVRAALVSVDDAVAVERYRKARAALRDLVEATIPARRAGQLTSEQADGILAAAARVDASLPKPPPPQPVVEESGEPAEDFEKYDNGGAEDEKHKGEKVRKSRRIRTRTTTEGPSRAAAPSHADDRHVSLGGVPAASRASAV